MSAKQRDKDAGPTSPTTPTTPPGGANLFSPSGSESAHRRARSILPGVRPRELQTPYGNRLNTEMMREPPPAFNLPSHPSSSHSSSRQSQSLSQNVSPQTPKRSPAPSTPTTQERRIVSPQTASLMKNLQKLRDTEAKSPETTHPAIKQIRKHAAATIPRVWGLRNWIDDPETQALVDVDLLAITSSMILDSQQADSLGQEVDEVRHENSQLKDEISQLKDEISQLKGEISQLKASVQSEIEEKEHVKKMFLVQNGSFKQYSEDTEKQMQKMTLALENASKTERELHRTIGRLQGAELAHEQGTKPLSDQVEGQLIQRQGTQPDPQNRPVSHSPGLTTPTQSAASTPMPTSMHRSRLPISAGVTAKPKTALRPSAMEFHQQVLTQARSIEKMRLTGDRPVVVSDTGSPVSKRASLTTVSLQNVDDEETAHWRGEIGKVLTLVRNYARAHWRVPSRDIVTHLQNEHPAFWAHLLKVVNPVDQDRAGAQVARLLADRASVAYVVERVISQFLIENVLAIEAWLEWDGPTDSQLREIEAELKTTEVFKHNERQALIDRRAKLINARLGHQKWAEYNSFKRSTNFQRLRQFLVPLTSALRNKEKEEAIYDLYNVVDEAWLLAPKIWSARVSLEFLFHGSDAVLTTDMQNVVGQGVQGGGSWTVAQQQGQGQGGNIRFVVRPLVTLRDERGVNRVPKLVIKTDILLP